MHRLSIERNGHEEIYDLPFEPDARFERVIGSRHNGEGKPTRSRSKKVDRNSFRKARRHLPPQQETYIRSLVGRDLQRAGFDTFSLKHGGFGVSILDLSAAFNIYRHYFQPGKEAVKDINLIMKRHSREATRENPVAAADIGALGVYGATVEGAPSGFSYIGFEVFGSDVDFKAERGGMVQALSGSQFCLRPGMLVKQEADCSPPPTPFNKPPIF